MVKKASSDGAGKSEGTLSSAGAAIGNLVVVMGLSISAG